jgi:segregation and condensation protein B
MNNSNKNSNPKTDEEEEKVPQEASNLKTDEDEEIVPQEASNLKSEENKIEEKVENEGISDESNVNTTQVSNSTESEEDLVEKQLKDFHRNQIEASLYVAGRPLSIEELNTKLEISKKEIEELINELAFDYLERSTSLLIVRMGEKFQMQIKPEYTEKVSKFAKGGAIAERYLRTLTIIALKQPILKSLVIKLRGTGAYEHVKYLLDNALITAVKQGRSELLTTTDKYAEMFGLPKNIEEMKKMMVTQLGLDELTSKTDETRIDEKPQE